ncbi:MAG TPA: NAD-dependent epimerase/dehydratase family protein [Candidatus Binataceae bacterium]|nr:NAD-dependent epimerase/dehydratase family protein [Candidatus Binataceae bacterium]
MTTNSGGLRVVVTGGAGFIGSHLVERLLREGHRVRVLDNPATGREANLAHLRHHAGLEWERVDINEEARLSGLLADAQWVFHLAGLADIVPSIADPRAYHWVNVNGTVAMLEAARAAGASRFIYAASSSCYGLPCQLPTPETAPAQRHHSLTSRARTRPGRRVRPKPPQIAFSRGAYVQRQARRRGFSE